jgi:hypothetical protein
MNQLIHFSCSYVKPNHTFMLKPTVITSEELNTLCQHAHAIDNKGGYPAVIIHPDNTITKLWARKKKLLSSATLLPYSNRFIINAAKLIQRNIMVPEILSHSILQNSRIRLVTYRSLPGRSIRELLRKHPSSVDIPKLCAYIYQLQQKGILFRGMHLGSIIQCPQGKDYGLIDFTDVRFYARPLSLLYCAANFSTPLRYKKDIERIQKASLPCLKKATSKFSN